MRLLFTILVLPAVVFAVPEKRFVLDDILKLVNKTTIYKDLELLFNVVGSDPTEQACEQAGHRLLSGLLDHSVPLLCHSFQELVHHFHIGSATTTAGTTTAGPVKRLIMDQINMAHIRQDIQHLVDVLGNDATEQVCEEKAHQVLKGLLYHSTEFLCHSFKALVNRFHIVPDVTTTASSK